MEPVESFATSLAKVRRLTGSTLTHQSKPAQLLVAIESTISSALPSSSSTSAPVLPHAATAYFAALSQCLERACSDEIAAGETGDEVAETENMGPGGLIPATLYLLAIVIPETPTQVVLSKLSPLLECALPLFDVALDQPGALKSLLQIITSLVLLAPASTLASSPLLKKAWAYLLELNLDPRPKVRHLAQEGVRKVLTTPIPPRVTPGAHPYLPKARDWVSGHLQEEVKNGGGASGKGKRARFAEDAEDGEGKKGIWIVQGLRGWVTVWGEEHLSTLCTLLLSLPPTPHLTPQIYSLLSLLLTPPPATTTTSSPSAGSFLSNLPLIVDSLLTSPPDLKSSAADIPTYLSALTSALVKLSLQDQLSLATYLPRAFNLIFNTILLSSPNNTAPATLQAASDAVGAEGIARYCLSDEMIVSAVTFARTGSGEAGRKKQKTPLVTRMISALSEALETHALKLPYLLPVLTALVSRLRLRVLDGIPAEADESGTGRTAAEELLLGMVKDVGDLRTQRGFEHVGKLDEMLGMAIEVMGVEAVLTALPLNIEPDATGVTPFPGRAHLLPLIRSRTTNDSLAFFANYFRPLSERIFGRKVAADEAGRSGEAKVWDVVVGQIWDCLAGFCEMPRDLREGLTTPFLSLLTKLLYTQPLLLPSLLRALSQLVSSTQRLATSAAPPEELRKQFGVDQTVAAAQLEHLKSLAKDMVSVLLNVFSKMPRESRGMVGDVVGLWVGIMSEKDMIETYNTVTTHLSSNLNAPVQSAAPGSSPVSHTMLDLLIIFVPHLPAVQSRSLLTATASPTLLSHPDATVQKKSYRLISRLLESSMISLSANELEGLVKVINEVAQDGVGPGTQRDRLVLLGVVVDKLPSEGLGLMMEMLSEAVLGTKEVNEKARDAGFELVVRMARRMQEGGVVNRGGELEDGSGGQVQASAEEFVTMVAAGLTGTTPHMISASINALSRLIFEFKDDISPQTLHELIATLAIFLTSKNREVVKSCLGFIKVATVGLPIEVVEPHLPQLVPALLGWVHDHKNHFKLKTVHIFERMMRKFGNDEVINCAPKDGSGQRKVLEGIRKRKEKAKRKKAGTGGKDEDEDEDEQAPKQSSGNAFDDILYNSDSDLSDDGSDQEVDSRKATKHGRPVKTTSNRKSRNASRGEKGAAYIRDEGDEPMDLLSRSIAGGITRANPALERKRKPGQDAQYFKTDKSGKLVIPDDSTSASASKQNGMALDSTAGEGSAYVDAQRGVDAQRRDARGNLKFVRDTKRARAEEMEVDGEDGQGAAVGAGETGRNEAREKRMKMKGKKEVKRLGEEFKAKRAGGDIKRAGGPDPYSYVPIGQAAKRRGGKEGRINLTNKKRGSRR